MSMIVLGILIGLLASCVQSYGLTLQRKSHIQNQALPEDDQRVEYRRPLFLLGFTIFISSNILGSLIQIASLPVVILAPLGAVSLLWNAFFAKLLLGDVFSPWMVLGTLLIAGGAVLIGIFGVVPEPTRSLEDLLELFNRPTFIAYFTLLGAVVVLCLAITHIAEFALARRITKTLSPPSTPSSATIDISPTNPSALTTGVAETIVEGVTATETTPLLASASRVKSTPSTTSLTSSTQTDTSAPSKAIQRTRLLLAISYASFSGILSGMCLIFAKSGVELLMLTVQGDNQFWRWQAWMLILGLVVFALLQLWYLHKALILANPTLVCPSAFCFYNLSSIVNGLVYFNQFSLIPPLHLGLVVVGIVVLLAGVWIVSIQSSDSSVGADSWDEETSSIASSLDDEVSVSIGADDGDGLGKPALPMSRAAHSDTNILTIPSSSPGDTKNLLGLQFDAEQADRGNQFLGTRLSPQRQTHVHSTHSHASTSVSPTSLSPTYLTNVPSSHRHPHRATLAGPSDRLCTPADTAHRHLGTHQHARSPSYPYSQLSPPLGATIAALGAGGLQIGLSPISPGFSVAARRTRHVSTSSTRGRGDAAGMSLSRSDTLPPPHQSNIRGAAYRKLGGIGLGLSDEASRMLEARRRRTVSEGDITRMAEAQQQSLAAAAQDIEQGLGESSSGPVNNDDGQGSDPTTNNGKGIPSQVSSGPRRDRDRWKWLKKVTGRR